MPIRQQIFCSVIYSIIVVTMTSCQLIVTPPLPSPHGSTAPAEGPKGSQPLYVFSHGHHTGLSLPSSLFDEQLFDGRLPSGSKWIEFGWGDEGFYRSEEIGVGLALKALFLPTRSVMHVCVSKENPRVLYPYSPSKVYWLDESQQKVIVDYISSSFATDKEGAVIALGPGRYGISQFYRGRKFFFFPRSCNSWTAGALRSTGKDFRAITSPSLMRQIFAVDTGPPSISL